MSYNTLLEELKKSQERCESLLNEFQAELVVVNNYMVELEKMNESK